ARIEEAGHTNHVIGPDGDGAHAFRDFYREAEAGSWRGQVTFDHRLICTDRVDQRTPDHLLGPGECTGEWHGSRPVDDPDVLGSEWRSGRQLIDGRDDANCYRRLRPLAAEMRVEKIGCAG